MDKIVGDVDSISPEADVWKGGHGENNWLRK